MNADLREAISRFLMNVYSPDNLDTARDKLERAVDLLNEVIAETMLSPAVAARAPDDAL